MGRLTALAGRASPVVGLLSFALGTYLNALDLAALGIPGWIWQSAGFALFAAPLSYVVLSLHRELEPKYPDLDVVASVVGRGPAFDITNHGSTDIFQVTVEDDVEHKEYLSIGKDSDDKDITQQELVKGAHTRFATRFMGRPAIGDLTVQFLSRTKDPLVRGYTTRCTSLDIVEIKETTDPWPRKNQQWRERIETILCELEKGAVDLAEIPDGDKPRANEIMEHVSSQVRRWDLVGHGIRDRHYAVHRRLIAAHTNSRAQRETIPANEFVVGYRECVDLWIQDLRSALAAESPS